VTNSTQKKKRMIALCPYFKGKCVASHRAFSLGTSSAFTRRQINERGDWFYQHHTLALSRGRSITKQEMRSRSTKKLRVDESIKHSQGTGAGFKIRKAFLSNIACELRPAFESAFTLIDGAARQGTVSSGEGQATSRRQEKKSPFANCHKRHTVAAV
jgi:hypothetical protein